MVKAMKIETNLPLESLLNLILNYALSSIGANAGSLMTVNNRRGILQIRTRLGTPKKGRKGEPEYELNGVSIASQCVKTKKAIVNNDFFGEPENKKVESRSENKIQSILSIPILYNDEVIAVINADSEDKKFFTKQSISDLKKITEDVGPLIAERISFLDALKEVSFELSKLPFEGEVNLVLQKIADVAVKSLGIDVVTLYEYDQAKNEFNIEQGGPKVGGALVDSSKMRTKVEESDVPYYVIKNRAKPLYFTNVKNVDFLSTKIERLDSRSRFIKREGIESMAALLLPNRAYNNPKEEIVGVLFANYKRTHNFNVDEKDALATFADYAATAILTSRKEKQRREEARILESAKKSQQIQDVLDNIVAAVTGKFNQTEVLDNILKFTMDILQAEACSIYLKKEEEPEVFECIAGAGFAENIAGEAIYRLGEGLTGTIAKEGVNIHLENKSHLDKYKKKRQWIGKHDLLQWGKKERFKNLIGVPIKIGNQIIGVIKAENKGNNETFTNDDLEGLKIIGTVIGLTLENVRLQNKIESQLKSISAQAAHRINNQLANYAGIELEIRSELNKSDIKIEKMEQACNSIFETTEGLKELANEIQRFGKPIQLKLIKCGLNKIIEKEAFLMKQNARELEINLKGVDATIPDVLVDPVLLSESIKELLANSQKALKKSHKKDGLITIKTRLSKKENTEYIEISIEDNGPGFPKNFPVFEPYKTTDSESTGLGLSIVKEVVEKHNGKIHIRHSTGIGAIIELSIPV